MDAKKRKYTIYAIIGIAILVATYFGTEFLKGSQLFKNTNLYYVYYDKVDGLNTSSLVQVNGYKIGKVVDIKLLPERNCSLLVTLELLKEFPIPDSSVAEIVSTDIMGTKGIEMHFSDKTTYYEPESFIIGKTQENLKDQISSEVIPVKKAVEDLMSEITDVIDIISGIFNEGTQKNLEESFTSLKNSLVHLESSIGNLDGILDEETNDIVSIIADAKTLADSIAENSDAINNIIKNMSTFSDTLTTLNISKTINEANNVISRIDEIVTKVNNGEGTLGELVADNSLALQIENATMDLDKLLTDIRLNPKKYINLSLSSGKTYYVTDEGYLSEKDLKKMKQQQQEDLETAQKNLEKELKAETKGGLYFLIQIKSSDSKLDLTSKEFKNHNDIIEIKSNGMYRYFLYPHSNPKYTETYIKNASADFSNAEAKAMYNGTIVSYEEGKSHYQK